MLGALPSHEFGGLVPLAPQSPYKADVITCNAGGETEALSSTASERLSWASTRCAGWGRDGMWRQGPLMAGAGQCGIYTERDAATTGRAEL